MDKMGSDYFISFNSLIDKLSIKSLLLQVPIGIQSGFHGVIDIVNMKTLHWNQDDKDLTCEIIEHSKQTQGCCYRITEITHCIRLLDSITTKWQ